MTSMFSVGDFGRSFERHLRTMRKSPRTVKTYMEAVQLFSAFLDQHGGGGTLLEAQRADIEALLVHLHKRCTLATVANRYRRCGASTVGSRTRRRSRSPQWPR
jgi:site-specific recombinase XerD